MCDAAWLRWPTEGSIYETVDSVNRFYTPYHRTLLLALGVLETLTNGWTLHVYRQKEFDTTFNRVFIINVYATAIASASKLIDVISEIYSTSETPFAEIWTTIWVLVYPIREVSYYFIFYYYIYAAFVRFRMLSRGSRFTLTRKTILINASLIAGFITLFKLPAFWASRIVNFVGINYDEESCQLYHLHRGMFVLAFLLVPLIFLPVLLVALYAVRRKHDNLLQDSEVRDRENIDYEIDMTGLLTLILPFCFLTLVLPTGITFLLVISDDNFDYGIFNKLYNILELWTHLYLVVFFLLNYVQVTRFRKVSKRLSCSMKIIIPIIVLSTLLVVGVYLHNYQDSLYLYGRRS